LIKSPVFLTSAQNQTRQQAPEGLLDESRRLLQMGWVGNFDFCAVMSLSGSVRAHSRTDYVVAESNYRHKCSEDWESVSVLPIKTLLKRAGFYSPRFSRRRKIQYPEKSIYA